MVKKLSLVVIFLISSLMFYKCNSPELTPSGKNSFKILFLHHSTGKVIWEGNPTGFDRIRQWFSPVEAVPQWFKNYNAKHKTDYYIEEMAFPKNQPYGWKNYPYDYYTIWVKNAGENAYMEEPTLEMLTRDWNMIILKHCFPVSDLEEDSGYPDVNTETRSVENYKLQYLALRQKIHEFPETKFLLWTGAAQVERKTTPEKAQRSKKFFDWVRSEWDIPGDNIFIWDFYGLETEGGLYLKNAYARNRGNSHPGSKFAGQVAPLLCQRIVDVIENNGDHTDLIGVRR